MEKLEYIPINIWDDFYDDGYVPEGEEFFKSNWGAIGKSLARMVLNQK